MSSRTRVYVGKIGTRTREGDIHELFSKYGHVRHVDVKYGFAFVDYDDQRDAEEAVHRLHDSDLHGNRIIVEFSRGSRGTTGSTRRESRGPSYGPPQRSDYRARVENLPRDMSWQDLKDLFRAEADVIFADVWYDRGRSCGAVEFRSREELRRAIRNLDGTTVRGCNVRVSDDSRRSRSRSRSRTPTRKRRRSSRSRSRSRSASRSPRRRSHSRSRSPRDRSRRSRSASRSKSASPSPSQDRARRSRSPSPHRSRSPRGRSPRRDEDEPNAKRARTSPPPADGAANGTTA